MHRTAPHPENGAMIDMATTVTDMYSAGPEAVDITTTIHVDRADVPFTAGLGMALTPSGVSAFWTPWAKGCVQNPILSAYSFSVVDTTICCANSLSEQMSAIVADV